MNTASSEFASRSGRLVGEIQETHVLTDGMLQFSYEITNGTRIAQ